MERDKFFVGVNSLVVRDNKILLGKRKDIFGDGKWGLPGGHLELKESMQQAAARELLEETGMVCNSFVFSNIVNDSQDEGHYLQIGFLAQDVQGEPLLKEPDKCYGWQWFDLNKLPEDIFEPCKPQIKAFLENKNFIDF